MVTQNLASRSTLTKHTNGLTPQESGLLMRTLIATLSETGTSATLMRHEGLLPDGETLRESQGLRRSDDGCDRHVRIHTVNGCKLDAIPGTRLGAGFPAGATASRCILKCASHYERAANVDCDGRGPDVALAQSSRLADHVV